MTDCNEHADLVPRSKSQSCSLVVAAASSNVQGEMIMGQQHCFGSTRWLIALIALAATSSCAPLSEDGDFEAAAASDVGSAQHQASAHAASPVSRPASFALFESGQVR